MDLRFRHLVSLEDRLAIYPLYSQLNPYATVETFTRRMTEIMVEKGYHLLAVYDAEKLVALSGYWLAHKLYCGKYLEPDNVVVDEAYRSTGVGSILQEKLEEIASENGCNVMMLDAYIQNTRGHAFYERHGYVKKGYHFVKKLADIGI